MVTFEYLREFNFVSVCFRLFMAMIFGGVLGLERAKKGRAAGFRTYMFVCIGAALTVLLSQYEAVLLTTRWADVVQEVGVKSDVSRFGAQVINGIGFLGAGTIITVRQQQVKGLTTAAGLWASACMGLAIGAGFYEAVLMSFVLIFLSIGVFHQLELNLIENTAEMTLYIEFTSLNNISPVITKLKELQARIYSVEIDRGKKGNGMYPNAVFSLHLQTRIPHSQVVSTLSGMDGVTMIKEI
ncbi:MAG: MgtC/SapB family protein [Lachnospiraceae bacterium]|nr:MgtC/SapB family protein [Lachnospiraceae bacterium]